MKNQHSERGTVETFEHWWKVNSNLPLVRTEELVARIAWNAACVMKNAEIDKLKTKICDLEEDARL